MDLTQGILSQEVQCVSYADIEENKWMSRESPLIIFGLSVGTITGQPLWHFCCMKRQKVKTHVISTDSQCNYTSVAGLGHLRLAEASKEFCQCRLRRPNDVDSLVERESGGLMYI